MKQEVEKTQQRFVFMKSGSSVSKLDWWEDKEVRAAAGVIAICIEYKAVVFTKKKTKNGGATRRRRTFVSKLRHSANRRPFNFVRASKWGRRGGKQSGGSHVRLLTGAKAKQGSRASPHAHKHG